jgi:hypothetical protein
MNRTVSDDSICWDSGQEALATESISLQLSEVCHTKLHLQLNQILRSFAIYA